MAVGPATRAVWSGFVVPFVTTMDRYFHIRSWRSMVMSVTSRKGRHALHNGLYPMGSELVAQGRSRRLFFRLTLIIGAVFLAILIWLTPAIIVRSPIFGFAVDMATSDIDGRVSIESASLGWFSPISLAGVKVQDVDGNVLLEVPNVKSQKSLLGLLWGKLSPGKFRIEKPKLRLVVRADGSNVEDLLAKYLEPSDKQSSGMDVDIEVVDGTLMVVNAEDNQTWRAENLQLTFNMSKAKARPIQLHASCDVVGRKRPGRLDVGLKMCLDESNSQEPAASGKLSAKIASMPLGIFNVIIDRFSPKTRVSGTLSSTIDCRWSDAHAANGLAIQARADTSDFTISSPMLKDDNVRLGELSTKCVLSWKSDAIKVSQMKINSDFGNVSLEGTIDRTFGAGETVRSILGQTFRVNGQLDLARLVAILPNTVRIREKTRVDSGKLQVSLDSKRGKEGMAWKCQIKTSDLTAMRLGKELVWQQPISLALEARETAQGPVVERLECQSEFLKVKAAGTPEDLTASLSFNLGRLAHQLAGFFDMGGLRLFGNGWSHIYWKRSDQGVFDLDGEVQVRDFEVAVPNQKPWRESNVIAFFSAGGQTKFDLDTRLDRAKLEVRSDEDRLKAELTKPVSTLKDGGRWSVGVSAEGELARWLRRVEPLVNSKDWRASGRYRLAVDGTGWANGIELREARLDVQDFRAEGLGVNVVEPNISIMLAGRFDRPNSRLLVKRTSLKSNSLVIHADNVIFGIPDDRSFELAGNVAYRGYIDRIQSWFDDPKNPLEYRLAGQFTGSGVLRQSSGMTSGHTRTKVKNFVMQGLSKKYVHEPEVELVMGAQYKVDTRVLTLHKIQLTANAAKVNIAGEADSKGDQTNLALDGTVAYDIEKLVALLRPYVGDGVQVFGRHSSPVSFRGPVDLDKADAHVELQWTAANAYGFQVGPGNLAATLTGGVLNLRPVDLDVSEGRLTLTPQIRMSPEPVELYLAPGPLAQQVRVNPTMCARALQYIAPILAGVATAEGRFSMDLEGCRIPVGMPDSSELAGRFVVHSMQVGPGPLVRELSMLLGRVSVAKLKRESVVKFRMTDGRIYHEGLELEFPELTIRTHGSVGLDHSLSLIAEMPIPPKWLRNRTTLTDALRNQIIRLPISGTLEKPRIDRRTLDRYTQQFVKDAAGNIIEQELNKQLDRLFQPR